MTDRSDRSPIARYSTMSDLRDASAAWIVSSGGTVRASPAFGEGTVAKAADSKIAATVADALNQIDPAPRVRVMRGIGWW